MRGVCGGGEIYLFLDASASATIIINYYYYKKCDETALVAV